MSGGYFNYDQHRITQIADDIQAVIDDNCNDSVNDWGDTIGRQYSPETIDRLNEAVYALRVAQVYAHRVDWLLSDDDGEGSFIKRLVEELEGLNR